MILYQLSQNTNEKMPNAYGKYYAHPVITQTYSLDQLSAHMANHNTPFSPGAIKGILTDAVVCIRELVLQGIAVKIDNLAIFSVGIKNRMGAKSEADFSVVKNIIGVKMRARATGGLMSSNLTLDASLKKATSLVGGSSTDGGNDTGDSEEPGDTGGSGDSGGSENPDTGGGNVNMD